MNKYQKIVSQLAKDDMKKIIPIANRYTYRCLRNCHKAEMKGWSIERMLKFKKWNKDYLY